MNKSHEKIKTPRGEKNQRTIPTQDSLLGDSDVRDCSSSDSCSAESVITDASRAACDAENLPYDPQLSSFPAVKENVSVRETRKPRNRTNASHILKDQSTSAILMENMDMYMLNPCNNKIWFIIELCQPIQVKQLDIANFEIFSSNPKDFLVSISDRYPNKKWLKLGTFHARDERTVQSFPLDEHLFAKYIKVELLSHFGSEHFCPLSLIRVFGTSMMEEYEMNILQRLLDLAAVYVHVLLSSKPMFQDQRQTDSIQSLQVQLENVTQLVLSLSVSVSRLQQEVSDRQSYILLCLLLCVLLGLLICVNYGQISESPAVDSQRSCCSDRDELLPLRRRASDPLSLSSLHTPDGGSGESSSCKQWEDRPAARKKKHKVKLSKGPETLTAPSLAVGIPQISVGPLGLETGPHPDGRDLMSDNSSEGSSQADETLFCGIGSCARLCETLPAPKRWTQSRSQHQRGSRRSQHLHQPPQRSGPPLGSGPTPNPL
ncbi:hypothetical protein Q8A67_009621 [Cirrhinus molitorella]|uniref:SUN domain-containing protein n=1 Tax=Cirrhinus molitorella TaxID=172907 RepID=A0AA88TTG9_9TELE|nr:hypothetical protein Q8A67_009621 [Cirrhinus molitorella]